MTGQTVLVRYLPTGVEIEAHVGDTLLDAALDNGLSIQHECGGNCACTTCQVMVESGWERLSPREEVEQDRLSTAEGRLPYSRLACQAILIGGDDAESVDVTVVLTVVETLE